MSLEAVVSLPRACAPALAAVLALAAHAAAEPPPFYFRSFYGGFNQISQMTQRADGLVFIADSYSNRVVVYGPGGAFWQNLPPDSQNPLYLPSGVAFDHAGHLFVADQAAHHILKYSTALIAYASFGSYGSGPGQLSYPTNLAISPDGTRLYVTEYQGHRVTMFDPDFNYLGSFGGFGSGPGQFNRPWGIAMDAVGDVFVSDELNHRIQRFDATGHFLGALGGPGSGPGEFNAPTGLAFDLVGSLYVCDELNNRVQKFSNTGGFLSMWGTYGSGPGEFYNEWAILPLQSGDLWVSNTYNYRIDIFSYVATAVRRTSWRGLKALYR